MEHRTVYIVGTKEEWLQPERVIGRHYDLAEAKEHAEQERENGAWLTWIVKTWETTA